MTYDDVIKRAPNPELADKIMTASYILARGQPNVPIELKKTMELVMTRSLESLKEEARKIAEEKLR